MKFDSEPSINIEESSESYGHQFRLKNRKNINNLIHPWKNRRISEKIKQSLISMITKENCCIKYAGRLLGISYSTAKKIFTNFRLQLRAKKESDTGEQEKQNYAQFIQIEENDKQTTSKLMLISSIAGQVQNVQISGNYLEKL